MTTDNKRLTLSYGAFSCSLIGFDQCLHAITPLAEYLRDLVEVDAEHPDANTLTRIIESATSHRVEAREDAGHITLTLQERREPKPEASSPSGSPALDAEAGGMSAEAFFANSTKIPYLYDEEETETPSQSHHQQGDTAATEVNLRAERDLIIARLRSFRDVVSPPPEIAGDVDAPVALQAGTLAKGVVPVEGVTETKAALRVEHGDTAEAEQRDEEQGVELNELLNRFAENGNDAADHVQSAEMRDTDDGSENLFREETNRPAASAIGDEGEITDARVVQKTGGPERKNQPEQPRFEATVAAKSDLPTGSGESETMLAAEQTHPNTAGSEITQTDHDAQDALPAMGDTSSEDVSRLMAEAENQMEDPGGATRRNAFSHVRAAVAARFADKSMREKTAEEESKPYRNDLADVVKPRRPVARGVRREHATEMPTSPLKLAPEQRVYSDSAGGKSLVSSEGPPKTS